MTTAPSTPAALIRQLETTWQSIIALCDQIDWGEWRVATACPGWSVHDQVAHVMGTEAMLCGRESPQIDIGEPAHVRNDVAKFNEAWIVAWRDRSDMDLLDELRAVTAERLASLRTMSDDDFLAPSWTPVGQATYARFMQIRVFDCWIHEQDIRVALNRPGHQDGPAAEQAIDEIERALGLLVGKRAAAPEGARVTFELTGPIRRTIHVAVRGRAAVVDELDGPADVTIRTDSQNFVALTCRPPLAAADRVMIEGDSALGEKIVAALNFTI